MKTIASILLVSLLPICALAQIETTDDAHNHMHHMTMDSTGEMHGMTHSFSPNLPMNRNGSGTACMPDATPMHAYMLESKKHWQFMFHGSIFFGFNKQDLFRGGSRGGQRFSAPNWFMGLAQKQIGKKDLFSFQLMLSLERLTEGGEGYPLMFQSGETWNGKRIVDHQHPHDLFAGIGVGYTHAFNKDVDLSAYIGFPGEPALGPVAFMHRLSSFNNILAPISHHWQDATHITYGVGTIGLRWKWFKAEGSIFTGREPDENRWDFDMPRFDSYSYRLSINPHKELALQFSQGFIHSPESIEPSINVVRYTASVIHSHVFQKPYTENKGAYISSTLAWGLNVNHPGYNEHSILVESNFHWNRWALYTRYEWVQKDVEELQMQPNYYSGLFNIHALTLGSNVRVFSIINTDLAFGAQFTINIPDKYLASVYGTLPVGMQVYLHITPAWTQMKKIDSEADMGNMKM